MRWIVTVLLLLETVSGQGQGPLAFGPHALVYIVRHAEKQPGKDPLLTGEGNLRAGDLMRTLKHKDIRRIYVTQFRRTQNTADSMRLQLGIDTIQVVADTSCAGLFEAIRKNNDLDKPILLISHSNIIPTLIYKLGITGFPQENLPETEFGHLFIIHFKKGKAFLQTRKYGKPSAASAGMKGTL